MNTIILPEQFDLIAQFDEIENKHPERAVLEAHAALPHVRAVAREISAKPQPVGADCLRTFYPALRISGYRPLSVIRLVVMHAEEADTAISAASWFRNPDCQGSAHLCLDDNICYRSLPNEAIPWGAPGANYRGFHIEQALFTASSASSWERHDRMLERSAFKAAWHLRLFDLPPVFCDHGALNAGKSGWTTHLECTRAFGGDHTDPGDGWMHTAWATKMKKWYNKL